MPAVPKPDSNRSKPYLVSLRGKPCIVPRCGRPGEAAHAPHTQKLGGDLNNAVTLCHIHHMEQHQTGIETFATKYGLDLAREAQEATARFYGFSVRKDLPW